MMLLNIATAEVLTHLRGVRRAVLQPGVGAPVLEVDGAEAAYHQLQLALVERFEKVLRDQLIEAFLQSKKLLLYSLHEPGRFGIKSIIQVELKLYLKFT